MKELFEKYGAKKVSVTKYCDRSCSACGGYGDKIGYESCQDLLVYPEITPDKVLKLEEVLLQSQFSIKVNYYGDSLYAYEGCEGFYYSREEALASLLIKLYDSFTEDERLQIKEILEG